MKCGSGVPVSWDGAGYHRVASVQEEWGLQVLARVPPGRYRKVLDAGCGSGRLTAHLLRRFTESHVVGLDVSAAMLEQAKKTLARFGRRVRLIRQELLEGKPGRDFDLVFSNATFHWIFDHRTLFRHIYSWLAPGGLLVAQCGGRGNIRRVERLTAELGRSERFARFFLGFSRPVNYAGARITRKLLAEAGFRSPRVWLEPAPARFRSRAAFKDFIRNVICVPNLNRLPKALHEEYLDAFIDTYLKRYGRPLTLDYVRLNIHAVK